MKKGTIQFGELKKFNDSNSAVLMATTFPDEFDFKELDDFLSNKLEFSTGKNLIGIYRITGNWLGDEGRTDWLMEFDNEDKQFNCMARLMFPDIKWTSDFIDNYAEDFNVMEE